MPIFNIEQQYIAVSTDVVKNIVPEANPTFVKIYLYALYLASTGEPVDTAVIAKKLQLLESDVLLAMKYWNEKGVLSGKTEEKAKPVENNISVEQITDAAEENQSLKEMLQLAQEVLGKTISTSDAKTLYWIYNNLHIPTEVILMLLEYCVSINKRSMSYIEQVALSWSERGITTMEQADAFLKEKSEKNDYGSLKKIFGINSRDFTSIELNYLKNWTGIYRMAEEMIALAYEYCVLRINKISFPYMDKIIEGWFEKNIHTITDAEKDNERFKNSQGKKKDFDLLVNDDSEEEFESIMREKMNNDN